MISNIVLELDKPPHKNSSSPPPQKPRNSFISSSLKISCYSPKFFIYFLTICVFILIVFQIQLLTTTPSSSCSSSSSFSLLNQLGTKLVNNSHELYNNCSIQLKSMVTKLRDSVTFLPLKDLRYTETALQGHTWFMSSMYDTHEEGEVQYQHYPSNSSKGRLLCIKGRDNHDGAWNYYTFAYPDALPENATLLRGLTFVSYNHYNYENIWHGLSAVVPFVGWHRRVGKCAVPSRWILYHWGEVRSRMGAWLQTLMEATFGGEIKIETFEGIMKDNDGVACFEEAVVMRHNEGGMSRERRIEVYDLLRCKARVYCNVSLEGRGVDIGLTMFMRTGARSFRNPAVVTGIFERECAKVEGCRVKVAYSNNLTFCEQVSLMSSTDILVSSHGAQLTNMFFMDKNSSVMEFFPKGWLKLAGVGQFVYHWIASWSSMKHEGAWRDPNPDPEPDRQCQFAEDDRRCFTIYKSGKIGYNETYFTEWAGKVLNEVKKNKQIHKQTQKNPVGTKQQQLHLSGCACG